MCDAVEEDWFECCTFLSVRGSGERKNV